MNSIHDMGGMEGFGPVVQDPAEPLFHNDWERRVLGVLVVTAANGHFNFDESRSAIEKMGNVRYLNTRYYEHWLAGFERIVLAKGLLDPEELSSARIAPSSRRSVAPTDLTREKALPAFLAGGPCGADTGAVPRFAVGDRVRARNVPASLGYTRLPRYARGKQGVIESLRGEFAFADSRGRGTGDAPHHVYSVSFQARELWGEDSAVEDCVYLDLWEQHLDLL